MRQENDDGAVSNPPRSTVAGVIVDSTRRIMKQNMRVVSVVVALLCVGGVIAGENLFPNHSFEDGIEGWSSLGGGKVKVTTNQAHSGKQSLLTRERNTHWWGPTVSVLSLMEKDHKYRVSAWVRLKEPGEKVIRINMPQTDGRGDQYMTAATGKVTADEWTLLSGTFILRTSGELTTVTIHIAPVSAKFDFYVDDVSVKDLGKAEGLYVTEKGVRPKDTVTRLVVEYVPVKRESVGTRATIEMTGFDGRQKVSESCTVGQPVTFGVSQGLFRIKGYLPGRVKDRQEQGALHLVGDAHYVFTGIIEEGRKVLQDPSRAEYAGWMDYLIREAEKKLEKLTSEEEDPGTTTLADDLAAAADLHDWTKRIAADADVLSKMTGTVAWAYMSEVDGSGQPFTIRIPSNYTPDQPCPLQIHLHGSGGLHSDVSQYVKAEDGVFYLFPQGRGRSCGYGALAEVDVLDAIDYVKAHWSIDPDRVRVSGHSMGGGGTFTMATRHPDLFACARPEAGYGLGMPVRNMLHVPTYNLHSRDDYAVVVSFSTPAVDRLAEYGGSAIHDECDGVGHNTGKYEEGYERGSRWRVRHTRPDYVNRVHYTALDELARGAYWVEVSEWGFEGRPATIDANMNSDNTLYLGLDNVNAAKIDLVAARTDRDKTLMVAVNRRSIYEVAAPLPETLFVIRTAEGWLVTGKKPEEPRERLHFPGGAMALFHGEPLMVVWGTGGDEKINKAIYDVAQVARRCSNPNWQKWEQLIAGYPRNRMLYGELAGKPDSEVTADDMARYNLLLIGTKEQNSVVARMAGAFPVQVINGEVQTDDGFSWPFKDRAIGLLFYNPLVPKRLVYWVASEAAEFYQPGTALMGRQGWNPAPPDLMILGVTDSEYVAGRRFDSRWHWLPGYGESPKIPKRSCSVKDSALLYADCMTRACGADFALIGSAWKSKRPAFAAGETRLQDLLALEYYHPIGLIEFTGAELIEASNALDELAAKRRENRQKERKAAVEKGETPPDDPLHTLQFVPSVRFRRIDPKRNYRIVLSPWEIGGFIQGTHIVPDRFSITGSTMMETLQWGF